LKRAGLAALALLLGGCTSLPPPRQAPEPTPAPVATPTPAPPLDIDSIPDAVPRAEARSAHGNPPYYDVFGQRYAVLPSSEGFVERGVASWYGPNFHGKSTSSGEPYDMYAMTAAHRTLPIPCYARITNLSNGRSVIVRINDRGPFASNRIVDLSYTAAAKLDIIRPGTAFVELRTISTLGSPLPAVPEIDAPVTPAPGTAAAATSAASEATGPEASVPVSSTDGPAPAEVPTPAATVTNATPGGSGAVRPVSLYIQVGAYGDPVNAAKTVERLEAAGIAHVYQSSAVNGGKPIQRVRVGPVSSVEQFDVLVARLAALGFPGARLAPE
jgi:rare lipoprotein A